MIWSDGLMNTKKMVTIGLLAALCCAATFIGVPLPFLGPKAMLHLGTTAIYIAAVLIGPKAGYAGAIGCALFDLFTMPVYAIPTFIIKGLQGYAAGKISFMNNKKGSSLSLNLIGFTVGAIISLVGYFITDWILYGNYMTALTSSIGSILTSVVGIILSLVLVSFIKPVFKKAKIVL